MRNLKLQFQANNNGIRKICITFKLKNNLDDIFVTNFFFDKCHQNLNSNNAHLQPNYDYMFLIFFISIRTIYEKLLIKLSSF